MLKVAGMHEALVGSAFLSSFVAGGALLGDVRARADLHQVVAFTDRLGPGDLMHWRKHFRSGSKSPQIGIHDVSGRRGQGLSLAEAGTWELIKDRVSPSGAPVPDVLQLTVHADRFTAEQSNGIMRNVQWLGRSGIAFALVWVKSMPKAPEPPADICDSIYCARLHHDALAESALAVRLQYGRFVTGDEQPPMVVSLIDTFDSDPWLCDSYLPARSPVLQAYRMRARGMTVEAIANLIDEKPTELAKKLEGFDKELAGS